MSTDSDKQISLSAHWKCIFAISLVSLSPFQYGLDFGIIGSLMAMPGFLKVFGHEDPASPIGYNIDPVRQQLISSLMILGAFVMSSTAGITALFAGRKLSLWIACVLVWISTAMQQAGSDIGVVYGGRFIIGLANGILMTHSQLYIHECSPAKYRGLAISMFMFWISIGSLIGTIIDNATARNMDRSAYMIPLGIVHVVPGLMAIGMFFIPESPRWLMSKGKQEQAIAALRWLRPSGWSVTEELEQMQKAMEAEAALQSGVGLLDLFRNPIDRRRTLVSCGAMLCQAASGSMFLISYGTYFFQMAGVQNAFASACILSSLGVVAIIINSCIITRFGRRRVFIMVGLVLCGITMLTQAAIYTAAPGDPASGKALVGLAIIYIIGYNACISSYAWVASGEIPCQRLRSYSFGLSTSIGFLGAWLTTFTAPYFINPDSLNWGPKYGYIWTGSCVLSCLWVYFYLPETKDRTLEEIDELFEARLPARKFRKYQCTGSHEVLQKKSSGNEKSSTEERIEHV